MKNFRQIKSILQIEQNQTATVLNLFQLVLVEKE